MSVLSDKLNLIWYGDFELHQTNKCEPIKLEEHTEIKRVYRVDGNLYPTYRKGAPSNVFTTLECGYGYIIELEDGASINIPHANFSPSGDKPRGLFVAEVDISTPTPTPSPTPSPTAMQGCIPQSYTTINHTENQVVVPNFFTINFNPTIVGNFAYLPSDYDVPTTTIAMNVYLPNQTGVPTINMNLSAIPSSGEPTVYYERADGNCYSGKVVKIESGSQQGDYVVNLELIGTISTPTPTPSPSPSLIALECGKPNDNTFSAFNLEEVGKVAVGESDFAGSHTTSDTGVMSWKGEPTHVYTDNILDVLPNFNIPVPPNNYGYLSFSPADLFGEMRGELIYQRNLHPFEPSEKLDWTGIGSKESYCYFEGDTLPTSAAEMTKLCRFQVVKGVKNDGGNNDNTIFLHIDGDCYTGELNVTTDHDKFGSWVNDFNFIGETSFLIILKKV